MLFVRVNYFLILLFLTLSCKFNVSPYSSDAPKILLNYENLKVILDNEPAGPSSFKIALISDTHNYYKELTGAVNAMNRNGPYNFVILSGDVSNLGLLEEYEETHYHLSKLKYPYLVAVGNHDLLANGEKIFSRMFGDHDFSFIYQDIHFVFFNNNNWESGGAVPDTAWVESELMASTAGRKVLVAHVSPRDKDRWSDETIQAWKDMSNTYGVNYFLNGHDHNPVEYDFGPTTQGITIGAPSKKSYYELIVTPGGITHQKINF